MLPLTAGERQPERGMSLLDEEHEDNRWHLAATDRMEQDREDMAEAAARVFSPHQKCDALFCHHTLWLAASSMAETR